MKRLTFHPKVFSDIDTIMAHYQKVATRELADEFYAELRLHINNAARHPESFALRGADKRRVNLSRFPYHFYFRVVGDAIRILVVRHHRRHPAIGSARR